MGRAAGDIYRNGSGEDAMMDKIICNGSTWWKDPTLKDNRLEDGIIYIGNSISGDELSIDTLDFEVYSQCLLPCIYQPSDYDGIETSGGKIFCGLTSDDVTKTPYGTPVSYYRNDELFGKFYLSSVTRNSISTFSFDCTSGVGILDKLRHYGGLYTGQTVETVLDDIIGGAITYAVSDDVKDIAVYGWLPVASRRDNLRQLLFAAGASIKKNTAGTVEVCFLTVSAPTEITDDRLYLGGEVAYNTPATGVDVTEHSYIALESDSTVTLFDNTDGSGAVASETVEFKNPCHNLIASDGLAIVKSGVNFAVLTGIGTLTGQEYTHQTKIVSERVSNATGEENIVSVTEATLVSIANSRSVAKRVLAYQSAAKNITADMIVGTERPGDAVAFNDPFEDDVTGIVQSMDINISGVLKASSVFVIDYVPTGQGNNYTNYALITEGGTWTKPDGVTNARVVLIGGGHGGQSGVDGADATMNGFNPGNPGEGGTGGQPGIGGKILAVDVDLSSVTSVPVSIGSGGSGGVASGDTNVDGSAGTATTFGDYSSDDGASSQYGFINLFTGTRYGYKGTNTGYDGGKGSKSGEAGESITVGDVTYMPGANGANKTQSGYGTGYGGYGGGAAYGSNGGVGEAATLAVVNSVIQAVAGGDGGKGADAADGANATDYGAGGDGGHGGGGGGNAGVGTSTAYNGSAGLGGSGGNGGDGAPGCAIIFW